MAHTCCYCGLLLVDFALGSMPLGKFSYCACASCSPAASSTDTVEGANPSLIMLDLYMLSMYR